MIFEQQDGLKKAEDTIGELRAKLVALRGDCCDAVQRCDELRAALIDCAAMLEHYVERRRTNWDGSTESQARSALVKAREVLAKVIA